ncbi:MAG TPA: UDP-N-acetylglucosamine--N-acetylmuramyl-(pentapeptide) pyrophosphoryl-undecaprenol N-acetylglucosamine transferase [Patescibacteria group bacterium]
MSSRTKKIWLVGGGTGGHVVPLLAVAEVLKKDTSISLTFIGEKGGQEATLARQYGLRFIGIRSGKLRRYITLGAFFLNLRDIIQFLRGLRASYILIKKEKPSLIFTKGGYVTLPVALAAYLTSTPLVIHESDAVMGMTNRWLARLATVVMTGFSAVHYPAFLAPKIQAVGIPLRSEFSRKRSVTRSSRPMILITAGSQGAVAINMAMAEIIPLLLKRASVMHITGRYSYERFRAFKESLPPHISEHYGVVDFTPDMADYMREATVLIMRSGSQIFEGASLGKPMVLIPLPGSANNHQARNAEIFAQHKAALVLNQHNLTPERLYETINSVLDDAALRHELEEGTRVFNSCDSAKRVAEILKQQLR